MRNPLVQQILGVIDRGYNVRSWHGAGLKGSIRNVDTDTALVRIQPNRHNISEIVVHAAYWKYAVRRRLTGEKKGAFLLKGSNWFERGEAIDPQQMWIRDVSLLDHEHTQLREAVLALTDADLTRQAGTGRTTIFELLAGIAAHDVYHAGQIQLIKRFAKARPAR